MKETEVKDGQQEKENRQENASERAHGPNKSTAGETRHRGKRTGERTAQYNKELTVEVEGTENVTMMDGLKEAKKQCGYVVGCRVRVEKTFEN